MVEFSPEIIRESLNVRDIEDIQIQQNKIQQQENALNIQETAITPTNNVNNVGGTLGTDVPFSNDARNEFIQEHMYNETDVKLFVEEEKINNVGIDIFKFPMFTKSFCETLMSAGEEANIWTTARHENYPTTDVLLGDLRGPSGRSWDEIYEEYLIDY